MTFTFTPSDGYNNTTSFPTTPASESAFRASMQSLHDQTRDEMNSGATSAIGIRRMAEQAIINGNFDIWQRGTSFTNPATAAVLPDRWKNDYNADSGTLPTTIIHSRQNMTPGDVDGSYNYYRINVNGAGSGFGANADFAIRQKIENGTRFLCGASKKVTVSFYAKSSIAGKKIGIRAVQRYGTGGTPTGAELINGESWTLTSTWTKYTHTFTTNTLVGKSFGTANDDNLDITFGLMWGSTFATNYGAGSAETFVGSGNIDIARVQLNAGESALPFQPRRFAEELQLCQRYYEKSYENDTDPGSSSNDSLHMSIVLNTAIANGVRWQMGIHPRFTVEKRIVPTVTLYNATGTSGQWYIGGSNRACSVTAFEKEFWVLNNTGGSVTPTLDEAYGHWTADAEIA